MSISIADVPGENLTPGSRQQDFVLNSHPVMVAPDAKEFMAFLEANEAGGLRRILYFAAHPALARIGLAAQQHHSCHLDIPYWSATPYLFGPGRAVKYLVRPRSNRTSAMPSPLTDNYLGDALRKHLDAADATFDFLVQFQVDADRMPIEDATVEWKEEDSPYVAGGAHPHPAAADRGARRRRMRGVGVRPVALTGRASPARQLEPCAPGDLPGPQCISGGNVGNGRREPMGWRSIGPLLR